jgi:hypothetical protein
MEHLNTFIRREGSSFGIPFLNMWCSAPIKAKVRRVQKEDFSFGKLDKGDPIEYNI